MSIFDSENDRCLIGADSVAMTLWRAKALASDNPAWIAQLSSRDREDWIRAQAARARAAQQGDTE